MNEVDNEESSSVFNCNWRGWISGNTFCTTFTASWKRIAHRMERVLRRTCCAVRGMVWKSIRRRCHLNSFSGIKFTVGANRRTSSTKQREFETMISGGGDKKQTEREREGRGVRKEKTESEAEGRINSQFYSLSQSVFNPCHFCWSKSCLCPCQCGIMFPVPRSIRLLSIVLQVIGHSLQNSDAAAVQFVALSICK